MGFLSELENIFVSIGTDVKKLRDSIGALNSLSTEDKSSLVSALNELSTRVGTSVIDDSLDSSNTKTYSIDGILDAIESAISVLTEGTDDDTNTLLKLSNLVSDAVRSLEEAVDSIDGKVSYEAQEKSEGAKSIARANIMAADARSVMASFLNTNHTAIFTGDIGTLPVGTFTVSLSEVTGLGDDILAGVGIPLGIISMSSSVDSVSRLLIGSGGLALYSSTNPIWLVIGGSSSDDSLVDITETYKVTLAMVGLEVVTIPLSNILISGKRVDVFCNGLLLMESTYAIVDNTLLITIEDLGYALSEDDVLCIKFKSN